MDRADHQASYTHAKELEPQPRRQRDYCRLFQQGVVIFAFWDTSLRQPDRGSDRDTGGDFRRWGKSAGEPGIGEVHINFLGFGEISMRQRRIWKYGPLGWQLVGHQKHQGMGDRAKTITSLFCDVSQSRRPRGDPSTPLNLLTTNRAVYGGQWQEEGCVCWRGVGVGWKKWFVNDFSLWLFDISLS